jgi:hypothetical protein
MKKSTSKAPPPPASATLAQRSSSLSWQLGGLGLVALIFYAFVAELSLRFVPGDGHEQRPIIAVLLLLAAAHLFYLVALWQVAKNGRCGDRSLAGPLWVILGFALAFRLLLIPSNPIQEIDIYRYLWDGQVSKAGVNPYAYSPAQIEAGLVRDEDRVKLQRVLRDEAAQAVFRLVDHRNVPTVYPPASQATFLCSALLVPDFTPLRLHVMGMKLLFVLFDIGSLYLLFVLLQILGKPPLWCLAYAWCPLVLKEVANSGHLDSQAVFFTTLTMLLLVKGWRYFAMLAWATAILSKWYPLLLLPLMVRQLWEISGERAAGFSSAVAHGGDKPRRSFARRSLGTLLPLIIALGLVAAAQYAVTPAAPSEGLDPREAIRQPHATPLVGLRAFLTEWEMNDLVFHGLWRGVDTLWSADSQAAFLHWARDWWPWRMTSTEPAEQRPISPSFVLTYLLVGTIVGAFALWWVWRDWQPGRAVGVSPPSSAHGEALLTGSFYVLAVFFLLNPTCNPWYLLGVIPLLPWAKQRVWYLLPAVALQYYLWFWFDYHHGGREGQDIFNDVWLWVEWGPFLGLLAGEVLSRRGWRRTENVSHTKTPVG